MEVERFEVERFVEERLEEERLEVGRAEVGIMFSAKTVLAFSMGLSQDI